jgi:site-specific DNA-adenine methylase
MRYLGGKSAIAADIASFIVANVKDKSLLVEPFCGGGAMTVALAPYFQTVQAYDIHEDLILMWQALRQSWEPPEEISESDYTIY